MTHRPTVLFAISTIVALGGAVNPAAAQGARGSKPAQPAQGAGVQVVQVSSASSGRLTEADSAWRSTTGSIRNDLRYLAVAQEVFRVHHGTYADDVRQLAFSASEGVSVKVLRSDAAGWSASARHAELRGGDCVIYVGIQETKMLPRTQREARLGEEGEPVCDAPAR